MESIPFNKHVRKCWSQDGARASEITDIYGGGDYDNCLAKEHYFLGKTHWYVIASMKRYLFCFKVTENELDFDSDFCNGKAPQISNEFVSVTDAEFLSLFDSNCNPVLVDLDWKPEKIRFIAKNYGVDL